MKPTQIIFLILLISLLCTQFAYLIESVKNYITNKDTIQECQNQDNNQPIPIPPMPPMPTILEEYPVPNLPSVPMPYSPISCIAGRPDEIAQASNFKSSRKAVYSFHILAWISLTIAGFFCVYYLIKEYGKPADVRENLMFTYWAFLCVVLSLYSNGIDAMMNVNDKSSEIRDAGITSLYSLQTQSKLNFDIAWASLSIVFVSVAIALWALASKR